MQAMDYNDNVNPCRGSLYLIVFVDLRKTERSRGVRAAAPFFPFCPLSRLTTVDTDDAVCACRETRWPREAREFLYTLEIQMCLY